MGSFLRLFEEMSMTAKFGDTEDVRALSDDELRAREEQMLRNRDPQRFLLLRQWLVIPANEFERQYVEVSNELQRRGLLEVD